VLPECRLLERTGDGASAAIHLTDLLEPGFTALRFGAHAAQDDDAWQQLQSTLDEQRIPFKSIRLVSGDAQSATGPHVIDPTGHLHDMLDARPGTVYLIRPDGHVLARWRDGSAAATQRALSAALTI
jgi:3-(3-hydroxy-phenyl)propionate hydroxylase